MKIYTKTGDNGTSSLYNGERRPKHDSVFDTLGDIDELNSLLGVCRDHVQSLPASPGEAPRHQLATSLEEVQSRLLDAGSAVATPLPTPSESDDGAQAVSSKLQRARFPKGCTEIVESWIDALDAELPPLTTFILPSGGQVCNRRVCVRIHVLAPFGRYA